MALLLEHPPAFADDALVPGAVRLAKRHHILRAAIGVDGLAPARFTMGAPSGMGRPAPNLTGHEVGSSEGFGERGCRFGDPVPPVSSPPVVVPVGGGPPAVVESAAFEVLVPGTGSGPVLAGAGRGGTHGAR